MELNHNHLVRQLDLIPVEVLGKPISVIGCGAIGSFLVLQLVKMGFTNVTVWDPDEVSVENMSCQFFRFKDIGVNKATALRALVEDFTGVRVTAHPAAWDSSHASETTGVVISAVDCMDVRRLIYETVQNACFKVTHIIDPRMSAEFAAMYVINPFDPKDQATYEKTLYSNEDAVQERCTAKSTVYTANLLSGMCAKAVKNLACRQTYPRTLQWDIAASNRDAYSMYGA